MTPKPGIYENVPFDEYCGWDAHNQSRLTQVRRSLAHYRADVHLDPSPSLTFGALTHTGVLEKKQLGERYAVLPPYEQDEGNKTLSGQRTTSKSTIYYKECVAAFLKQHRGKKLVTEDEYNRMQGICAALIENPKSKYYLGERGRVELSLLWIDPKTKLLCKGRIDKLLDNVDVFVDLKTTSDAMKFEESIGRFGYHRQAGFYQAGLEVLTKKTYAPVFVVVETGIPYGVMTAEMAVSVVAHGRACIAKDLKRVADAERDDYWPGYTSPKEWLLPARYWECDEEKVAKLGDKVFKF